MRFNFIKQLDTMQCGVACLAMICMYYKKAYRIERLSMLCGESAEGISLFAIYTVAKRLGLHSICGKTTIEKLAIISRPCILHWNQNHFVVLYKIKKGKKFYIADPAKGLITYTLDEFKEHWISTHSDGEDKGVAMFLEPTPAFYANKEFVEGNKEKRSFRFLFGYILNSATLL